MIAKVCATSTLQNIALRLEQVLSLSFQNIHVHHLRDRSTFFANFGQSIFAKLSLTPSGTSGKRCKRCFAGLLNPNATFWQKMHKGRNGRQGSP